MAESGAARRSAAERAHNEVAAFLSGGVCQIKRGSPKVPEGPLTIARQFHWRVSLAQVMKMSPAEAIAAATINGAWALRLAERKGTIESGKDADFAVFNVKDYREIPYWFGANHCSMTVLNGVIQPRN